MFAELLKLKHKQLQAILFDITIVLIILFVDLLLPSKFFA